ncbi:hypothetical protein CsSME_00006550 [Camellia sinensis var. sinensis]
MKKVLHHHLLSLLLFIFSFTTDSKSVIEPCYSSDSCPSLLSYRLPWDSKLSEVAFIFQLNISDILGSNNIDAMVPWSSNQILPARSLVKVPTSCQCVNGIRRSVSTIYTVRASDTWNSIAKGYGELVSAEQIRISNVEVPLTSGQRLVIPLPCMCLNNTDGEGGAAVYMSYVVEIGENLSSIGDEFGTTVHELEGVNGFDQSQVSPGDVLAIPIPACSSANLRWYNESLVLPNGSYTLTANNCVKCSCDQHSDLSLQCSPSGIEQSCPNLQCKGSNLFIGDAYERPTTFGCSVNECVYRGHFKHKIYKSLVNSSYIHCSGNMIHTIASPASSPSLYPSSSTDMPMVIDPSNPTSSSMNRKLLISPAIRFCLFLLEISLPFIF